MRQIAAASLIAILSSSQLFADDNEKPTASAPASPLSLSDLRKNDMRTRAIQSETALLKAESARIDALASITAAKKAMQTAENDYLTALIEGAKIKGQHGLTVEDGKLVRVSPSSIIRPKDRPAPQQSSAEATQPLPVQQRPAERAALPARQPANMPSGMPTITDVWGIGDDKTATLRMPDGSYRDVKRGFEIDQLGVVTSIEINLIEVEAPNNRKITLTAKGE